LLQAEGAQVIELPTQEIVDLVAPEIIGRVADALIDGQYGWVIFSSPRTVELLFRHLTALGRDTRSFHGVEILAMGPGTEEALADRGLLADLIVESPNAEAVLAALRGRDLARRRVLLPRAEEIHRNLLKGLRQAGAEVEDVPLYIASVPREPNRGAMALLKHGEIDAVAFPASVAVTNLVGMLGDQIDLLRRVTIACQGPISVQEAEKAGLRVDVIAEPASPAGLVRALSEHAARLGPPSAAGIRGSK